MRAGVESRVSEHRAYRRYSDSEPADRAPDFEDQGALAMELIATLAAFGVILVIVWIAFNVGREKK